MNEEDVRKVKDKHVHQLFKFKGVVGVGIGRKIVAGKETNQLAIVVDVVKKLPENHLKKEDIVPKFLEGVPVDVQEVGVIRALKKEVQL